MFLKLFKFRSAVYRICRVKPRTPFRRRVVDCARRALAEFRTSIHCHAVLGFRRSDLCSRRSSGGYSLVELLIAIACASILSLAAWNVFSFYERGSRYLAVDHQRKSAELFEQIQRVTKNARGLGERLQNRF